MQGRIASQGRGLRQLIPWTVAALSLSLGAGIALGQTGGTSENGGIATPASPTANDVQCVHTCAGLRQAGEGSIVQVDGRALGSVTRVTFPTAEGTRIRGELRRVRDRDVRARVPAEAVSGRVRVVSGAGGNATTPTQLRIVGARELSEGGNFRLTQARAAPRKTYFFGPAKQRPRINYTFNGEGSTDVRIQVIRLNNGRVVRQAVRRAQAPLTQQTWTWNGRRANGKVAPNGRYRFRVGAVGNGAGETTAEARFEHYDHTFPVRPKRVGWGDGMGAGRGHQGQDLFAACGTRLVAARGGKVLHNQFHGAAGWYIVIGGQGIARDYMYAHLQRKSPLRVGQTVRTGQAIGRMGATGNAHGCHLHFELWSGPGWYRGGSPLRSITQLLRRWHRWT